MTVCPQVATTSSSPDRQKTTPQRLQSWKTRITHWFDFQSCATENQSEVRKMRFGLVTTAFALLLIVCRETRNDMPGPVAARPSEAVTQSTFQTTASTDSENGKPLPQPLPAEVAMLYKNAQSSATRRRPFPHRILEGQSQQLVGYVIETDAAGTTAQGFGGPVPLRLYLDSCLRPRHIEILGNDETPAYLELVIESGLLDRLVGFDHTRPDSIDAVSLATLTSRAIIQGVTATLLRARSELHVLK